MKKLFLLISTLSVGIISHATAAHISGVKFNNICTQNTSSKDNEDFRDLIKPIMIYKGYSENCEIELNWNSPDYNPNKIQFWIDLNDDKKETNDEYFNYNINVSGNSGSKVKVIINNFSTPSNSNLKKDAALNMKITMIKTTYGLTNKINSELYWITFRSVDFPHITKNILSSKTINDPNPDFLVDYSIGSKTQSNLVSFNYVKGNVLTGSITVKRENSNVVPTSVRVYLDLDRNGSYSFSEKMYEKPIPSWSSTVLSKVVNYDFFVPTSIDVMYNIGYSFKVEVVNSSGLGEAQKYTVYFLKNSSAVRIDDDSQNIISENAGQKSDVLIYPNPAVDNFTISHFSDENAVIHLNLISEIGQVKFQNEYNVNKGINNINISAGNLPKGLYFVELLGESGLKLQKKILIQ